MEALAVLFERLANKISPEVFVLEAQG